MVNTTKTKQRMSNPASPTKTQESVAVDASGKAGEKRKQGESTDSANKKGKTEVEEKETEFLRHFLTWRFDAPFTLHGPIKWRENMKIYCGKVPQNEEEFVECFVKLVKYHSDCHYGSFELQCILDAAFEWACFKTDYSLNFKWQRGFCYLAGKFHDAVEMSDLSEKNRKKMRAFFEKRPRLVSSCPFTSGHTRFRHWDLL